MKKLNKKGFTLIEMLVVIAIIAILVAIIVPTVSTATAKSKAAADAANLRSVAAEAAIDLLDNDKIDNTYSMKSKTFPGADLEIWNNSNEIKAYFKNGSDYYDVDAFSATAQSGDAPVKLSSTPSGTKLEKAAG